MVSCRVRDLIRVGGGNIVGKSWFAVVPDCVVSSRCARILLIAGNTVRVSCLFGDGGFRVLYVTTYVIVLASCMHLMCKYKLVLLT